MRIGIGGGLLAVAATLLLALAAAPAPAAEPKPGWEERKRSLQHSFSLPADNGYRLGVRTDGHRQVALTLSKGAFSATYTTTGKVNRHAIEAEFGTLGEVSVKLDGRPVPPRPFLPRELRKLIPGFFGGADCRGRKPEREVGHFRGTIRFSGERGYASVETTSVKGRMVRTYRRLCKRPDRKPRNPSRTAPDRAPTGKEARELRALKTLRMNELTVGGNDGGRHVYFSAMELEPKKWLGGVPGLFGVSGFGGTEENREGMKISRSVLSVGDLDALRVSPRKRDPATAATAFGKPFEGRAKLTQPSKGAPSWSGTMLMRVPGLGGVPLTGPEIGAVLCRTPLFDAFDPVRTPCMKRSEELLPPDSLAGGPLLAQLSGSHSQALADVRLSISR